MAAGAGRHALIQLAATEQFFTPRHELGIGRADAAFLAGEVGGDVGEILVAEIGQQASHFQHGSLARLDVVQLFVQVTLTLTRQFRKVGRHAVAIRTMASATDGGFPLTGSGIAGGMGETGDPQGQQQTHDQFVHQLIQYG